MGEPELTRATQEVRAPRSHPISRSQLSVHSRILHVTLRAFLSPRQARVNGDWSTSQSRHGFCSFVTVWSGYKAASASDGQSRYLLPFANLEQLSWSLASLSDSVSSPVTPLAPANHHLYHVVLLGYGQDTISVHIDGDPS